MRQGATKDSACPGLPTTQRASRVWALLQHLAGSQTCRVPVFGTTNVGTVKHGVALMNFSPESRIPIAHLQPSLDPTVGFVEGLVTLIWPYSSSNRWTSILLAEPDFRLRRSCGQVRISFIGASAKAIAKSGLTTGDRVSVRLTAALWLPEDTAGTTAGRGPGWELQYGQRLLLQVWQESTTCASFTNKIIRSPEKLENRLWSTSTQQARP